MPKVELVYDGECPNVSETRTQLLRAFAEMKLEPDWVEWRSDASDSPAHVRGFGSPTVLVDGIDVAGAGQEAASCCRLYPREDGSMRGAPSVETIARALLGAGSAPVNHPRGGGGWRLKLATLPGIGAALLPQIACPACWPAYAGFLTSVGLGFLLDATFLLPITAALLTVTVGSLGFRARRRRGYGPFAVGLAASLVVLIGKFAFGNDPAMYAGLFILIAASVWNGWPRRRTPTPSGTRPLSALVSRRRDATVSRSEVRSE